MQNESDKIRDDLDKVFYRLHKEYGGPFGWDWRTLCIVKPGVASQIRKLQEELKTLQRVGL